MENSSEGYVLSREIVDPLKCSFCKLYLSYPPIFMNTTHKDEDVKYKCARCTIKTRFSFRDIMYENLARHMKFPCIFKGCKEILCWDDVRGHESLCDYRTIRCLASDCQESVIETNFAAHFKEQHKKYYYSEKISIENLRPNCGFCVLEKDNVCFAFFYDIDADKLRMCLTYLGPHKLEKQFEVTLHGKDNKSIFLTEQNLVQFHERTHCYRCLKGDCKNSIHLYRDYRRGLLNYTHTKIDKDIIKRTFGSDINCIIKIVDEKVENEADDDLDELLMGSKDVVIDEVTEDDETEKPSETLKTDAIKNILKCPECKEPLKEPIFQCLLGHALCKECKGKTEKCSTCDAKIDTTRNYLVEEVITNLKLYSEEEKLDDKEIMCPMSKCKETIKLSTISNHFKESHIENFHFNKVTLNNVYGYYNVDVLVKDGKTYLLFFDFDDFHFGLSVCAVEAPDLMYDVKLVSENKRYTLMAADQKVIKFNDKEHCFKCSIGTCRATDHTYRVKRKEIFRRLTTKFNRDCIRRAFKTSTLVYQITLKEDKVNKSDRVLKQLFECPICKDYMIPPIHQCVAGHTLCNVCKTKVDKCPSCEGNIEDTRNFILEDIAEVVELPCSFEAESCSFRAGIKRVASHELGCPLNTKKARVEETNHKNEKKVADENDAVVDGDSATVEGNNEETEENQTATDGNQTVTDGNETTTAGIQTVTDGNETATDGIQTADGNQAESEGNAEAVDASQTE